MTSQQAPLRLREEPPQLRQPTLRWSLTCAPRGSIHQGDSSITVRKILVDMGLIFLYLVLCPSSDCSSLGTADQGQAWLGRARGGVSRLGSARIGWAG